MSPLPNNISKLLMLALDTASTAGGLPTPLGGVADAFLTSRAEKARELLLVEVERGKLSSANVPDPASLGGYVLRLARAVAQGAASNNLVLLARYFFGSESSERTFDAAMERADILQSLTDAELRCLAIAKTALDTGELLIHDDQTASVDESQRRKLDFRHVETMGLFETRADFDDALLTLIRFGFVRLNPTWDFTALRPSPRLKQFLEDIDLEDVAFF